MLSKTAGVCKSMQVDAGVVEGLKCRSTNMSKGRRWEMLQLKQTDTL